MNPIGRNALIFVVEHPWGKEIQVCSNEVPAVMYGHTHDPYSDYSRLCTDVPYDVPTKYCYLLCGYEIQNSL